MKQVFLSCKNLSIGYDKSKFSKNILYQNLNFTLNKSEFVCLLGPNGAGKSTLLKTITGAQAVIDGEVFLKDKLLKSFSKKELAKNIAVVLTDIINIENMSVAELIGMGRFPYTDYWGILQKEDWEIIYNSMKICGIRDLEEREVSTLSDGERQKVMIAKSLAQNTPLIILDEPTAFLDFPSKIEIIGILRDLTVLEDRTILMTTHDLDLALQMSDRLWLLNKDYGFVEGMPEDLVLNGSINKFFDKPKVHFNMCNGKFDHDCTIISFIHVIGESAAAFWLRNALFKKGIQSIAEDSENTIEVRESDFEISLKGMDSICTKSIEEVMKIIELNILAK